MTGYTHMTGEKNFGQNIRILFFALLIALVFSSCIPLSTRIVGIPIYTTYIVIGLLVPLSLLLWGLKPLRMLRKKDEIAYVLSLALPLITSIWSLDPGSSFARSVVYLSAAFAFVIVRHALTIRLLKRHDIFVAAYILFILLTIVSLLQISLQEPIGIVANYFGEKSSEASIWGFGTSKTLRTSGTFSNANLFSQAFQIFGAMLVAKLLYGYEKPRLLFAIAISLLTFFIMISTLSRSGILFCFFLQFTIYAVWIRNKAYKLKTGVVVSLVLLIVAIVTSSVLYILHINILPGGDRLLLTLNYGRLESYYGALQLLTDPLVSLVGVGSGQFFEASTAHGISYNFKSMANPEKRDFLVHNWILLKGTEQGLITLGLMLYAFYKTAKRGWSIRHHKDHWIAPFFSIILVLLYGIPLQFGTTATTPTILTLTALIMAWIQNEYDQYQSSLHLCSRPANTE